MVLEATVTCYNKKSLDLVVKLPSIISEFEPVLRKLVSSAFLRGAVTVSVRVEERVGFESTSVQKRFDCIKKAVDQCHLKVSDSDLLHALFCSSELFSSQNEFDKEILLQHVEVVVKKAIQMAEEARRQEGLFLQKDFLERKKTLENILVQIESLTKNVVGQQVERLQSLLSKYIQEPISTDERLLKEVVLFADKVDISEEVSRLKHHFVHLQTVLTEEGPIGKKIDFLFQELLREFSTLGAKTSQAEVSFLVVQAKTELDKMREQVQNVE